MGGYFAGVLVGRVTGSVLARRHAPHKLLAGALALTAIGFAILWPAGSPATALPGLAVLGVGLGTLFPLGLSVTVGLAPDHAQLASGRAVLVTSAAVLTAPLTVGALAFLLGQVGLEGQVELGEARLVEGHRAGQLDRSRGRAGARTRARTR